MDFLECSICHVNYDENARKPHNSPCGHEYCSTCLKTLIKNGEYMCPKCRKKIKANVVDDLPINFGLIDVIRAFKANTIILANEAEAKGQEASNNVCSIHCKSITHWCSECQLWICVDCLDSHISLIGCSTTNATKAVEDLKDNHNKTVDQLMSKFEKNTMYVTTKIKEHTDKRKELLEIAEKHEKEVEKLQNVLLQGNIHKEELLDSKKHLNETYLPHEISDRIKVMTLRKQTLLSWEAKHIGNNAPFDSQQDLLKALAEDEYVYSEKIINNVKKYSKISQYEGNIYVHNFRTQTIAVNKCSIPFVQLHKYIPSASPLVFLELSKGNVVMGCVLLRLNKDLPKIKDNFIQLVTGECGPSLKGITLYRNSYQQLFNENLPFSQISVSPESFEGYKALRGNVSGRFTNGYLQHLYFQLENTQNYFKGFHIIGNVVKGLEIMQTFDEVTITDCGIVLENLLDR